MLSEAPPSPLAHLGGGRIGHELWSAWALDPLVLVGAALMVGLYWRGRRRSGANWRDRCFTGALAATAVALISPLDALSNELASAHMVQHLLLILVAAPLLALAAPARTLARGAPRRLRGSINHVRIRLRRGLWVRGAIRHPVLAWVAHAGTLWLWHASGPYGAALRHDAVHLAEHATLVLTGVWFWTVVIRAPRHSGHSYGAGIVLTFTMALQSVFLAALLTFARRPWYPEYAETTAVWGLKPLADQQLAGAIMWVPAGAFYVLVGVGLVTVWLRETERSSAKLSSVG